MDIEKYCTDHKKTLTEIAQAAGCTKSMMCLIRKGQRPGVDLAIRIERATGGIVSAEELLGIDKARQAAA